jgi:hypothetical protein
VNEMCENIKGFTPLSLDVLDVPES